MKGLKGKVAVVTGGSRGIGFACVDRLLEEGVKVFFNGRSDENGALALEKLNTKYQDVYFISGDMADEDFCIKTIQTAIKKFGKLDYLINNAFPFTAKALDATREDWIHTMQAGPIAYATMIQNYVKLRGKDTPGAIVNMSSISGHIAQPNRWTYNAAKGAVIQLTRCAAMDLSPNVRVNTLSPGWVWTDEVEKATQGEGREKWEPVWGKFHLNRRLGEPSEIASVAAFLLSDDAILITGTDIYADGGYLAMGSEGLGEASNFAGSV
ncbi:MAG: SDR family NAD(P)-dependent oxidoreductase [Candidatus Humimicrobiaceae bacterium]